MYEERSPPKDWGGKARLRTVDVAQETVACSVLSSGLESWDTWGKAFLTSKAEVALVLEMIAEGHSRTQQGGGGWAAGGLGQTLW